MAYTFTGDWFEIEGFVFNVGHEQLKTVNQMTYPNDSKVTRSTDGEATNISDIEYYTQPSVQVGFKFISAEDYHLLMQLLHIKQTMYVSYYDPDFNEVVTHQMYAHPTELQNFFTRGQAVEGVRDLTLTFVSTCKGRETYTVTLLSQSGTVLRTYPNIIWGRSILLDPQSEDSQDTYEYSFTDGNGTTRTFEFRTNERVTVFCNMTLIRKTTPATYKITINANNVTADASNPNEVEVGGSVDLYFTPTHGYSMPQTRDEITVTNAESYTWTSGTSTKKKLSIKNVKGDCVVTVNGIKQYAKIEIETDGDGESPSVKTSKEKIAVKDKSTITAIANLGYCINEVTVSNGAIVDNTTKTSWILDSGSWTLRKQIEFDVEWSASTDPNAGQITVTITTAQCSAVEVFLGSLSNATLYDGDTEITVKDTPEWTWAFSNETKVAISVASDIFKIKLGSGFIFSQQPYYNGACELLENYGTDKNYGWHWTFNVSGACEISGDGNGIYSDSTVSGGYIGYLAKFTLSKSSNLSDEEVTVSLSGADTFIRDLILGSYKTIYVNAFYGESVYFECNTDNGNISSLSLSNLTTTEGVQPNQGFTSAEFFLVAPEDIDSTVGAPIGSATITIGEVGKSGEEEEW